MQELINEYRGQYRDLEQFDVMNNPSIFIDNVQWRTLKEIKPESEKLVTIKKQINKFARAVNEATFFDMKRINSFPTIKDFDKSIEHRKRELKEEIEKLK